MSAKTCTEDFRETMARWTMVGADARGRRRSTCVPLYSYTIRGRRYSDTFDTMPETSSIDHREKLGLPPSATHDQNENATFCKACDNLLQSHRIKFE